MLNFDTQFDRIDHTAVEEALQAVQMILLAFDRITKPFVTKKRPGTFKKVALNSTNFCVLVSQTLVFGPAFVA